MNITRKKLQSLAGSRSFDRGEAYFLEGRVSDIDFDSRQITATVSGQDEYEVILKWEKSELEYDCDCPVGQDGDFCKHLVAAGLAWIKMSGEAKPPSRKAAEKTLREYFQPQDKGFLIELLLKAAKDHRDLREKLLLDAARSDPKGFDLKAFQRSITAATKIKGVVNDRAARAYVKRLESLIGSLEELFNDGRSAAIVELTELMLQQLEVEIGEFDEPDYLEAVIMDAQDLHLRACEEVRPDPTALAGRLFQWEMNSFGNVFSGIAEAYDEVLGDEGQAEYRRLTELEWSSIPSRDLDSDHSEVTYSSDRARIRITQMMASNAQQMGDLEALVEIKRRDLSRAYCYLEIAEIYRQAERFDQALEWAETGLKAFPTRDRQLVDFLVAEYHRRGRNEDAMNLIWQDHAEQTTLLSYQRLNEHALMLQAQLGWDTWRDKALAHLREKIAEAKARRKSKSAGYFGSFFYRDNSALVEIFLWEQRFDEAWDEACAGGCSDQLWIKVAAQREKEHPADAIPVYRRMIAPLVKRTNNPAYERAVALIQKIGELMVRLDQESDFKRYLVAIRAEFRAKRNFVKLLESVGK